MSISKFTFRQRSLPIYQGPEAVASCRGSPILAVFSGKTEGNIDFLLTDQIQHAMIHLSMHLTGCEYERFCSKLEGLGR